MAKKGSLYAHDDVPVGKSMTKQDGAQTPADVYRQYQAGQPIPETPPPIYGDISEYDYAEARNNIAAFQSAFEELPSHVREYFSNDAARYADFLGEHEAAIEKEGLDNALRAALSGDQAQDEPKAGSPETGDSAQTGSETVESRDQ